MKNAHLRQVGKPDPELEAALIKKIVDADVKRNPSFYSKAPKGRNVWVVSTVGGDGGTLTNTKSPHFVHIVESALKYTKSGYVIISKGEVETTW